MVRPLKTAATVKRGCLIRNSPGLPNLAKRSPRRPAKLREDPAPRRLSALVRPGAACRSRRFISPESAFAQSDLRTLQVGWAVIFRALLAATGIERRRIASDRQQPRRRGQNRLRSRSKAGPSRSRSRLANRSELFDELAASARPDREGRIAAGAAAKICPRSKANTWSKF